MTSVKKWMMGALSALAAATMIFAATCCETTRPEVKTFTVTLEYDATQGSAQLSPLSEDGTYEENEEVTLTVSPSEGFLVGSVTVNGSGVTLAQNAYSFRVVSDTRVRVLFRKADEDPGDDDPGDDEPGDDDPGDDEPGDDPVKDPLVFGEAFRGVWKRGDERLTVTEKELTLAGETLTAEASDGGYLFSWKGETYTLSTTFSSYFLALSGGGDVLLFVKDGTLPNAAFEAERFGTYLAEDRIEIAAGGLFRGQTKATMTELLSDGSYAVQLEGELYLLTFGEDGLTLCAYGDAAGTIYTKEAPLPELDVEFGRTMLGMWKTSDGARSLRIETAGMSVDDDPVTDISTGDNGGYVLTTESGEEYFLAWYGFVSDCVLDLAKEQTDAETGEPYLFHVYFAREEDGGATIVEGYRGEWRSENGLHTLSVTENTVVYDGREAELIVDTGYIESVIDAMGAPVYYNNNCYYFFVDGEPYFLSWYPDASSPVVDNDYFGNGSFSLPEEYRGTWLSLETENGALKPETTIVAEESSLTINGEKYDIKYLRYEFSVVWDGVEYELFPDGDSFMQLIPIDEDGIPTGGATKYFLKEGLPAPSPVPETLFGVYQNSAGVELVLGEDGATYRGKEIVLLTSDLRENGQSFLKFAMDGERISVDAYDGPVVAVSEGSGLPTVLTDVVAEEGEGIFAEELRGVYADPFGAVVFVVGANGVTIYDSNAELIGEAEELSAAERGTYTFRFNGADITLEFFEDGTGLQAHDENYAYDWQLNKV